MKHRVTCMDCAKTERIDLAKDTDYGGWSYYGKLNINSCQTDKFFYKSRTPEKLDLDDLERVSNPCYNPKVKPKYVEMWVCPECEKVAGEETK